MLDMPSRAAPSLQLLDSHYHIAEALVILTTADGEFETTGSASEFPVDLRVGIESVVNTTSLLLVQDNLQNLASILLGSQSLSNNLDGVYDISQDSIVDGGQSSGTRSLLCLRCSGSVRSLWSWQDTSRCEEEDMSIGELLLEFSGQSLLNLVEVVEERDWDEDDDRALAMADFELTGGLDLKWSEGGLEIWDVGFEFVKGGCNVCLELTWVGS